jgi:hypothetical protein
LRGSTSSTMPTTLASAMETENGASVTILRFGDLFGIPESSPEFSVLVGGPKQIPEVCEEYMSRDIRVDPTFSISGVKMMDRTTRSSRHAVGEAAVLVALNSIPDLPIDGLDFCISSLPGTDMPNNNLWQQEFARAIAMIKSGIDAPLFKAEFDSVPDKKRLSDWIATKWAPAVMRTYDIAAIRTGARPVFANSISGESKVEIVWQQLVNMETVTVGKMIIAVTDTGLEASRAPGDASKGFGTISDKPLNGEDVLVRRLAEAVTQAVDKGLANKVRPLISFFLLLCQSQVRHLILFHWIMLSL